MTRLGFFYPTPQDQRRRSRPQHLPAEEESSSAAAEIEPDSVGQAAESNVGQRRRVVVKFPVDSDRLEDY